MSDRLPIIRNRSFEITEWRINNESPLVPPTGPYQSLTDARDRLRDGDRLQSRTVTFSEWSDCDYLTPEEREVLDA